MRLTELLPRRSPGVLEVPTEAVEIDDLVYDSRRVRPASLFFCVPGQRSDGHDFAAEAVASGAAALVVERPLGLGVPEVRVLDARIAMAAAAARLHGDPTRRMKVVGVTGTNGKTTTAFIVRRLLEASGERCGLLGTVKSVIGGVEAPAARTTPEAIDLQADFAAMLAAGETACAMEVSSHALALRRTEGVHFAVAIFTNLTQDHLDFHRSMEDYFEAKRLLFVRSERSSTDRPPLPRQVQVINAADRYGRRLIAELPDAVTFGIDCEADYAARQVRVDSRGSSAVIDTPEGTRRMSLPLPGRFNVLNALGALAAAHRLGGDLETLIEALQSGVRVPGRFEPVQEGQDFAVIVDYAHTPDSLQNVLAATREISAGRVLCVVGAGGDRDRGKRPLMGEVGAKLADVLIVTSDNPRSEDPRQIVAEVLKGAMRTEPQAGAVIVEVDRRAAIERAVELAKPGDVLVIAGKGHEQGQELAGGEKVPFDDVQVAREALRRHCPRARPAGSAATGSASAGSAATGSAA